MKGEFGKAIQRHDVKVGIVGMGYVGLPLVIRFACLSRLFVDTRDVSFEFRGGLDNVITA